MNFRIDPRLPLTGEVRRILAEEIGKAIAHLEMAREKPEQGVHKCRKRLKSVRALLRLVRFGDEPFCQTENECYKQVSALLAGPREATALIETVDRLGHLSAMAGCRSAGAQGRTLDHRRVVEADRFVRLGER